MRRLVLAGLLTAIMGTTAPVASADYTGHLLIATSTFRLRGIDGHRIVIDFTVRRSGWAGTRELLEVELVLTDCAGTKCTTSPRYVAPPLAESFESSEDLSYTRVAVTIGKTALIFAWSAEPGFGKLPPAVSADNGATISTRDEATAVLIAGMYYNEVFSPMVRCFTSRASVTSEIVVSRPDSPAPTWPKAAPAGLHRKMLSRRTPGCLA